MACAPDSRRSAVELVREACEQATDPAVLTPERVLPRADREHLDDVERALELLGALAALSQRVVTRASAGSSGRADVVARERELRAARDTLVLAVRRLDAARRRLERHR